MAPGESSTAAANEGTTAWLAVPLIGSHWFTRLRRSRRYDFYTRALGGVWFLFLGLGTLLSLLHASTNPHSGHIEWPTLLSRACIFFFYMSLWWLLLIRPPPVARSSGLLPAVMGFIGTYLPWVIALFPRPDIPAVQHLASAGLILFGNALMIVVVTRLGRSFSIVPQARKLVTAGPYAIIRHPLYLVEEIMLAGVVLQYLSPVTLSLLIMHAAVQVRRALYEEEILRRAFGREFDVYAQSTWRFIPFVW